MKIILKNSSKIISTKFIWQERPREQGSENISKSVDYNITNEEQKELKEKVIKNVQVTENDRSDYEFDKLSPDEKENLMDTLVGSLRGSIEWDELPDSVKNRIIIAKNDIHNPGPKIMKELIGLNYAGMESDDHPTTKIRELNALEIINNSLELKKITEKYITTVAPSYLLTELEDQETINSFSPEFKASVKFNKDLRASQKLYQYGAQEEINNLSNEYKEIAQKYLSLGKPPSIALKEANNSKEIDNLSEKEKNIAKQYLKKGKASLEALEEVRYFKLVDESSGFIKQVMIEDYIEKGASYKEAYKKTMGY